MTTKPYTASLSRSQGRAAWSVLFRHPARVDPNTKKMGLRVRQGLGTEDEQKAALMIKELDQLLADASFHDIKARADAEKRFAPRVVEIFYHGMVAEEADFGAVRDKAITLPSSQDSLYRRALMLGTTGAGKTTLLRQIIGTNPDTERFPSISPAKTTVHETEVLLDEGPFRAVVTFFPMDEVREHLNECISEAILRAYRGEGERDVLRALLMHVNQRFRFNYVLGNGTVKGAIDDADEDDEDEVVVSAELDGYASKIDLTATNAVLEQSLNSVQDIAKAYEKSLKVELGASDDSNDQRVVDELFEEELDRLLRGDDVFHAIADALLDEIEKRFELLSVGTIQKGKQGWPISWSWETTDRKEFINVVTFFSSNYAPRFGYLLTPLVNGLRVAGPFRANWMPEGPLPKLVLLDGEGLGHTPKSVAAVSTSLSRRIESADAVVLVDNATQPMQAAPVAAMRDLVSSGGASKLILVFTHFDRVNGDNLPTNASKEDHVLASAENVLAAIGEELGSFAERALRERLNKSKFFVGGIDETLTPEKSKPHKRTVAQLKALLHEIDDVIKIPEPVESNPVYDRLNLALAVTSSAASFHEAWMPRLGLTSKPGVSKEHWKRVWALSKRLATPGWADEYDNLKPVADLRAQLQTQLYLLIQNPVDWTAGIPDDDKKQQMFDALAGALSMRILNLASKRVRSDRYSDWTSAFVQSGTGSSYARASIIGNDIYRRAAPIPDVTPSPDRNAFLHDVAAIVEESCNEVGAKLS